MAGAIPTENYRGMDDPDPLDLEPLLASYYRMCADAGIEPLPEDEARGSANKLMRLLVPAFAVETRRH
jgi:hypothetical protein